MYYPSKEKFIELSRQGNVIPVYSQVLADFDTPLSAFLKIDEGDFSYLLESVEGGENVARYSFLGADPAVVIESKGRNIVIREGKKIKTYVSEKDPIDEIRSFMSRFRSVDVDGLPGFSGGLVGYMGYDMVRFIEDIPDKNPEDIDMPDMQMALTDTMLIFDHVDHKIKVVSNAVISASAGDVGAAGKAYDKACRKVDKLNPYAEPVSRKSLESDRISLKKSFAV
jgi:anthranilate synthase component 1